MLIIGSQALKFHLDFVYENKPTSWDFICYKYEIKEWNNIFGTDDLTISETISNKVIGNSKKKGRCCFELIREGSSAELYIESLRDEDFFIKRPSFLVPASISTLFSIKRSHIILPIAFTKHIKDYVVLHKYAGGKDKYKTITEKRYQENFNKLKISAKGQNYSKDDFMDMADEDKEKFALEKIGDKLDEFCTDPSLPKWLRYYAVDNYETLQSKI